MSYKITYDRKTKCCACGKELDEATMRDGEEFDFYGTYCCDELIDAVCKVCYKKGERSQAQKDWAEQQKQ
jgi:hypothetical protein